MSIIIRPPWRVLFLRGDRDAPAYIYHALSFCKEVFPTLADCSGETRKRLSNIEALYDFVFPIDDVAIAWLIEHKVHGDFRIVAPDHHEYLSFTGNANAAQTGSYIVDCFSQRNKGILFMASRRKKTTQGGEQIVPVNDVDVFRFAEYIYTHAQLTGSWHFVLSAENQKKQILHVSPIPYVSDCYVQMMGPHSALLALYNTAGFDVEVLAYNSPVPLSVRDGAMPFAQIPIGALYVDYDETMELRGVINKPLLSLVLQCKDKNIPTTLITKHRGDIFARLQDYNLHNIFDHIEHLSPDPELSKALYIKERNAVIFDDSCKEKKLVHQINKDIRCFDPNLAACFLDKGKCYDL